MLRQDAGKRMDAAVSIRDSLSRLRHSFQQAAGWWAMALQDLFSKKPPYPGAAHTDNCLMLDGGWEYEA